MFAISTCVCVSACVCACVPLVNLSNKSCKQQQTNKPKANNTHTHKTKKARRKITQNVMMPPSVHPFVRRSLHPFVHVQNPVPISSERAIKIWALLKAMHERARDIQERERESDREWHSHSPGKRHVNRKKGFQQNNTPSPQSLLPETSMWIGSRSRRRRKRSNGSSYVPTSAAAAPHLRARQWPKVMRILTMCQGQGH